MISREDQWLYLIWVMLKSDIIDRETAVQLLEIEKITKARQTVELWSKHWN